MWQRQVDSFGITTVGKTSAANIMPSQRSGQLIGQRLVVLGRTAEGSTAHVDAMERLEDPRSGFLDALLAFYEEFSATLGFLFPP